jgi:hypothetical protein
MQTASSNNAAQFREVAKEGWAMDGWMCIEKGGRRRRYENRTAAVGEGVGSASWKTGGAGVLLFAEAERADVAEADEEDAGAGAGAREVAES